MERTKKDLLSGGRDRDERERDENHKCVRIQRHAARRRLTCGHRAHQHSVEFDDGAEDVFGVSGARQVFAVTFEDETFVLFLQQDQDVLQEQCVKFWKGDGAFVSIYRSNVSQGDEDDEDAQITNQ